MRHDGSVTEAIAQTTADLRAIAPSWAEHGLDLLLENHEDFTGAELATILDAVDRPAVAAMFDNGDSMMVGEEPGVALDAILPHALDGPEGSRVRTRMGRRAVGARRADRVGRRRSPSSRPGSRGPGVRS
jgi:Xylose isomerase-like TIM barrel